MRPAHIVLYLSFFVTTSCTDTYKHTAPEIVYNLNLIDSIGTRYHQLNRFNGTILVSKVDSIFFSKSYGLADYENEIPFTDRTAFKVGTLSEIAIGNILQESIDKGRIHPDSTLQHYLKGVKGGYTIAQLMDHTSGLPELSYFKSEVFMKDSPIIAMANKAKSEGIADSVPSQLNYALLALMLQEIYDQPFEAIANEYLTTSGLYQSYFGRDRMPLAVGYEGYSNYRGNGLELKKVELPDSTSFLNSMGLKTTPADLYHLLLASPDQRKDGFLENDGFSYSVYKNAKSKLGIIVLSNYRHPISDEITDNILAIMNNEPYHLPLARSVVKVPDVVLRAYSGKYKLNEYVSFDVEEEEGDLYVRLHGNRTKLFPQSRNQFFMNDRDAAMRFLSGPNNGITGVELLNGFLQGEVAKKIE
ncbi:MAG: serine hydrolase [Bacteroidota bacterium]